MARHSSAGAIRLDENRTAKRHFGNQFGDDLSARPHIFNLLDTPGHEDFSKDTYRTPTAVDCAIMVIDAAKGIEAQTRKLFEVCRLRNIPIITFINKVDREGLSPFVLLDEIADKLQLDVSPQNWPTEIGGLFHGLYDLRRNELLVADRSVGLSLCQVVACRGIDDPSLSKVLPEDAAESLATMAGSRWRPTPCSTCRLSGAAT